MMIIRSFALPYTAHTMKIFFKRDIKSQVSTFINYTNNRYCMNVQHCFDGSPMLWYYIKNMHCRHTVNVINNAIVACLHERICLYCMCLTSLITPFIYTLPKFTFI